MTLDQASGWVALDVTAAVQDWIRDPDGNYGVLLAATSEEGVQYTFLSREWTSPYLRPRLVIVNEAIGGIHDIKPP